MGNGQWDAQMKYDVLRAKIQKEKMEKEYNEWKNSKKKEKDEEEESKAAEGDIADAQKTADAARKKVKELEGDNSLPGGAIGDATKKVEDEVQELEHKVNRISPKLAPKSDKKFFGKDYPFDKR